MSKRAKYDELKALAVIKRLKKLDEPRVYESQLSKWGVPDDQTGIDVTKYLLSGVYKDLVNTVSMQQAKNAGGSSFYQLDCDDLQHRRMNLLIDILLPIVNNVRSRDPSISATSQSMHEAQLTTCGSASDPWNNAKLLMRNRWYALYGKIIDLEYMLIIVHARAFRDMLVKLEPKLWDRLVADLQHYRTSIKTFAQGIGLDYTWPIISQAGELTVTLSSAYLDGQPLTTYHLHSVVVNDSTGEIYQWKSRRPNASLISIVCRFNLADWPQGELNTPDITDARIGGMCQSCQKPPNVCWCRYLERCKAAEEGKGDDINPSFFQLMECSDERGIGVRSLVRIEKGVKLDIVQGDQLVPPDSNFEDTYFSFIDTSTNGNWTRFLNHSCKANAKFVPSVYNDRFAVAVVTTMRIEPMQEITVSYNIGHSSMLCQCGLDKREHQVKLELTPED
uniref:SET domain protein n=1 Tax=Arthroderma uncinatum TaxID=74035 RepID=UPI00144A75A4|nr:SET domain protein [Arthroderma uncinatum]KAF3480088.1 SET domain protein [Arthroderma uncinatum]